MLLQIITEHPEQIGAIVRHTPPWVGVLFLALLALGASQLRASQRGLARVTTMPVFMALMALWGLWSAFGQSGQAQLALALWAAAGLKSALAVYLMPGLQARNVRFDAERKVFHVPGSWVPMALILGIFLTKYAVGVELAINPLMARDTWFVAAVSTLYGLMSGVVLGRAVRLVLLARSKGSSPNQPSSPRNAMSPVAAQASPQGARQIAAQAAAWAGAALLGLLALTSSSNAEAGMGLDTLPGRQGDGPVTVMYPSSEPDRHVTMGPFTLMVARQGAVAPLNGRLVVVSHGSRSAPWTYTELARALVEAGFVVAFPEHAGDNWRDGSKIGPESFALRPLEVSRAIDAVAADPRFARALDFTRVGMWGMSAGGHTALSLAGGRWSAARLRDHCERDIQTAYNACTTGAIELHGGPLDGVRRSIALSVIRSKLSDTAEHQHTDGRIRAIVSGVPFAADFDFASLAKPVAPLGIVQALGDQWLLPQFNSGAVLAACPVCERVADLPTGGHGALLAPLPPDQTGWIARMLSDPPGFDRASELPALHARTVAFFRKHLMPS
jgi:predicted dienelactone hydrolase